MGNWKCAGLRSPGLFKLTAAIAAVAATAACMDGGPSEAKAKAPAAGHDLHLTYMAGPVEFTLSSDGSVNVALGREFATPIGNFRLSTTGSVEEPKKVPDGRFLLLRWRGIEHLYEIRTPDTLHVRIKQPVEIEEDIPGDSDTITLNITRGTQTKVEVTKTTKPPEKQAKSCRVGSDIVVCVWPPGIAGHYLW
jgi:hypothetical protein